MSFSDNVINTLGRELEIDWRDYRFVEFFSGGEIFKLNDLGDGFGAKSWMVISPVERRLERGKNFRFEALDHFDQWVLAVKEDRTILIQIFPFAGIGILLATNPRHPLVKRSKRALDGFLSSIDFHLIGCHDRELRELFLQIKKYALSLAARKREL